eukprot:1149224-Pelagomonas_calceolata.AAC.1
MSLEQLGLGVNTTTLVPLMPFISLAARRKTALCVQASQMLWQRFRGRRILLVYDWHLSHGFRLDAYLSMRWVRRGGLRIRQDSHLKYRTPLGALFKVGKSFAVKIWPWLENS